MDTSAETEGRREGLQKWIVSIVQAVAGAYLVVAGLVNLDRAIHLGLGEGGLRAVLGGIELLGGVLLVIPRTARYASLVMLSLLTVMGLVHVARLDSPLFLLELLCVGPMLAVVSNAFAPGGLMSEETEGTRRRDRGGGTREMLRVPVGRRRR